MVQFPASELDAETKLLALIMVFKPGHLVVYLVKDRAPAVSFDILILLLRKSLIVRLRIVVRPSVVGQELDEGFLPVQGSFGDLGELQRRILGLGVLAGRNVDVARGDGVRPQVELVADGVEDGADLALPSFGNGYGRRDNLNAPCCPLAPELPAKWRGLTPVASVGRDRQLVLLQTRIAYNLPPRVVTQGVVDTGREGGLYAVALLELFDESSS